MKITKAEIISHLKKTLDYKIQALQQTIALAKESRDSDTKSSVGDKYETSRAMMQIEIEKNTKQLAILLNQKKELEIIKPEKQLNKVEHGALATTTQGIYFFAIGLGKTQVNDTTVFAVSLASPVGKLFVGQSVNESIKFQGKEIEIVELS